MSPAKQRSDPDSQLLAEILSLAARVGPELIRTARLELLPDAPTEAESDLWYSDLVISRGIDGITLDPDQLPRLRRNLLSRKWINGAIDVLNRVHSSAPSIVRLEESLTQEALLHQRGNTGWTESQDRIERWWQGVLAAMLDAPETVKNLGRWVIGATGRLPADALQVPTARRLVAVANIVAGGKAVPDENGIDISEIGGLLTTLLGNELIGVQLLSEAIEFSRPPAAGSHTLTAPATLPISLHLSLPNRSQRSVVLPDSTVRRIQLDRKEDMPVNPKFVIETLSGDSYVLRPRRDLMKDRAVAVITTFASGRQRLGSGFLVGGRRVLTAANCTSDTTGERAVALRVVRVSDDAAAAATELWASATLDVAVLQVEEDAPWDARLSPPVVFARLDRRQSGMLENCVATGFSAFQANSNEGVRQLIEVRGTVYPTDEAENGMLLMRLPRKMPVGGEESLAGLPFSGAVLSGALLFNANRAIGVVVDHHPRQDGTELRAVTFDKIITTAASDPAARGIADALGIFSLEHLHWASGGPVEPLAGLVEQLDRNGNLPRVRDLNPYLVGTTESSYGTKDYAGTQDPYVPRTYRGLDDRLRAALDPGRMVLLVGPSKAGKTRTAFEAVRARWPEAHLLIPARTALAALVRHPRLQVSTDAIVVWLDDLERYLIGSADPLTPALLTSLLARPGSTVIVATLRTEERTRLARDHSELTRGARRVLGEALELEIGPTSVDPAEQASAMAAYPGQDLFDFGLAEQLAGAPYLLRQYQDAREIDPLLHAVIRTAVDWDRVGRPDPIPETDLAALARKALLTQQPDMDTTPEQLHKSIVRARTPPGGVGRVAALRTDQLPDRPRGYRPSSYLIAADDDQTGSPRPIPDHFWDDVLERANPEAAFAMSIAATHRDNITAAVRAANQAARAGLPQAMLSLGSLLENRLDPPDLEGARQWYQQAANAGLAEASNLLAEVYAQIARDSSAAGRRDEAVSAISNAVNVYRELAAGNLDDWTPDLARSLSNLSVRLVEAGRRDEALVPAEEAVNIYRTLAAGNPEAWTPDLAGALSNLSVRLAEVGRRDEALAPAEEAVMLRRELAAGKPDAWAPDLARSLNNLSVRLAEVGRRDEALAPAEEAVKLRRELAAGNPNAWAPDLAGTLNNLSNRLSEAGRRDEALATAEEAAGLYRSLAAGNPDAWAAELARSLNNLSVRLAEAGRRDEALPTAEEAAGLYRSLAVGNPDAWVPDLAGSLNNLSNRLSEAGRGDEALTLVEEAVMLRRELAAANPAAWTPNLARSLNNLSNRLSEAGRRDEALTLVEEAVMLRRDLAAANPAAWTPDLARSLNNLSVRLSEAGRWDDALSPAEEAVMLRRDLAAANPAAWTPDLADSLNNLSNRLSEAGRRDKALASIQEAATLRRDLAAANPAAWTPDLADSLDTLSVRLAEVGRQEEALAPAEEAVGLYRTLAEENPAVWTSDLADSLDNLSVRLAEIGRQKTALDRAEEAVGLHRTLAAENPAAWTPDLASSMNNLGNLLANQEDLPDLEGARRWYEQAAAAGNTDAMVNLGVLLADQEDLPDLKGARRWYEQAAAAGDSDAMVNLGILLAERLEPPDLEGARRWYERAAEAGDSDAMVNLGILLAERLEPPDLEGARRWYERAAEAGDSDAMVNLGILLAERLEPPDLEGARRWYERAARAGNAAAVYNVANLPAHWAAPPPGPPTSSAP